MAGGITSALVLWAISGLLSYVEEVVRLAALLVIALLVVSQETKLVHLRFPANHRQVPQEAFASGPYRAAVRFGFELGTGVRTYLPSSVPYLLAAALLLVPPALILAVLAGASFGLGRAAMAAFRLASPDTDRWDERLTARLRYIPPGAALTGVGSLVILVV
jgi:hypothetical protein